MFKKVFFFAFFVLALSAFGTSAFAAETSSTDYDEVIASLEKTNHEIEEKIDQAVIAADELQAVYQSDLQMLDESEHNARTEKYNNDLDILISDLYNTTLEMATDAINKAAEKGVYAEAYWTLVELGGRSVWIDPIRVGL
ncbi:MAG: hypothetical protein ABGX20_22070 [Bacillus sp. (in: firmicutes)]